MVYFMIIKLKRHLNIESDELSKMTMCIAILSSKNGSYCENLKNCDKINWLVHSIIY